MSRSNLLKTSDVTFIDLMGNGKTYNVPPFQRDYSWTEEQWEDLWTDIQEMARAPESSHYMGALVVEATSDRRFKIIDGQQRVATLSILALAIIDVLRGLGESEEKREENALRAKMLRERFIGEKDPASLQESSKLFLNDHNDAFYQDYLVQLRAPANPRGLSRSDGLLWKCFLWFKSQIKNESSGETLAKLLSETIARQLLFILITVEDELNAYVVFETLNARGLELSATDLLKNYLFSKVGVKSDLSALERRWKALMDVVRQERFPDFLRYHLLCEVPHVRRQRLFKEIRARVSTSAQIFELMESLENRAELFAALSDSEHGYWQELPDAKPFVRELILFRVKQMTPLLFAAYEKMNPQDFVRVLKLVSIISFRYTVISSLNPNELEPAYHQAAKALLSDEISRPAEVYAALQSIYVEDEKFKQDFQTKAIRTRGKHLAKYILCRLESDLSGIHHDYQADPGTIEHILPEHPTEEWSAFFTEERQSDFIYRLGNLTLLEPSLNRQVGNRLLEGKAPTYLQSSYKQTSDLVRSGLQEWTPAALNKRQEQMATRAVHIWRAGFP